MRLLNSGTILLFSLFPKLSECLSASGDSFVHPIDIDGKHFVDSVTRERFYIKGVDYQPGGSGAYDRSSDPLSDPDKCARDIYLMQQLGINTVRVYTINPKLDHNDCMTMLAAANIYLVLDVNSPLVLESINRYEPWTTYTSEYLRHVFEVVDHFSSYNNTLAYFIGNEIVNDQRSAAVSPPYIRAVTRDVRNYIRNNSPRAIPLGYSAADDLKYRTQLADYLTCGDQESAVDFYGVNTYQWCGDQTLESSGYDTLIKDHEDFEFPIFFSEYGCNHVQPRLFQEVEAIYSPDMTPYFDGGLVYEFTQEANDYGLVDIDDSGNAKMRDDFTTLQSQFLKADSQLATQPNTNTTSASSGASSTETSAANSRSTSQSSQGKKGHSCRSEYSNLKGAKNSIPESFGTDMIRNGVSIDRGSYNADLLVEMRKTTFKVYGSDGAQIVDPIIKVANNFSAHANETVSGKSQQKTEEKTTTDSKDAKKNSATKSAPQMAWLTTIAIAGFSYALAAVI